MGEEKLPYDRMLQDALRDVLRKALSEVSRTGLPGAHHFYITFKTTFPEVDIPAHLRATYPDDMTIVLQHQFYGLEVDQHGFQVSLSFRQRVERLRIPFAAVVSFVDPAVNFGLQFQVDQTETSQELPPERPAAIRDATATDVDAPGPALKDALPRKVVSLDSFRKK